MYKKTLERTIPLLVFSRDDSVRIKYNWTKKDIFFYLILNLIFTGPSV